MNTVSSLRAQPDTGRRRQPSVKDIARLAGVSVATVSRALTRPELVGAEKLRAVQDAAMQLNYVAHGAGRALSSGRTRTIGAILPTLDHAIFANTAFALQKRLAQDSYLLLLSCNEFDSATERDTVRKLIERGVDGLVLLGREHEPDVLALLERLNIPYVLTWTFDSTSRRTCIGYDHRKAAMLVVEHLLGLGHRSFGAIFGPGESEWQRERLDLVQKEIKRGNGVLRADHIVTGKLSYDNGQRGIEHLMGSENPPTAIICGHDIIAAGALTACRRLGVPVPERVSITGFEDLEITEHLDPPLTTVHFPADELGRRAGDQILQMVTQSDLHRPIEVAIDLRIRGTTGPAPET